MKFEIPLYVVTGKYRGGGQNRAVATLQPAESLGTERLDTPDL